MLLPATEARYICVNLVTRLKTMEWVCCKHTGSDVLSGSQPSLPMKNTFTTVASVMHALHPKVKVYCHGV